MGPSHSPSLKRAVYRHLHQENTKAPRCCEHIKITQSIHSHRKRTQSIPCHCAAAHPTHLHNSRIKIIVLAYDHFQTHCAEQVATNEQMSTKLLLLLYIVLLKSTIVKEDTMMPLNIMKNHWELIEEYMEQMNTHLLLLLYKILLRSTLVKEDTKMPLKTMKNNWQ